MQTKTHVHTTRTIADPNESWSRSASTRGRGAPVANHESPEGAGVLSYSRKWSPEGGVGSLVRDEVLPAQVILGKVYGVRDESRPSRHKRSVGTPTRAERAVTIARTKCHVLC